MSTPLHLDLHDMRAAASQACALLKVLGNPDRLMLLCQLTQGEYCVSDLETLLGIGQPTLSQQLGVLREERLVSTRREGKQIYYRIDSPEALAVMQVLYEQFCLPSKGVHA
ncbi:ArsR/SmtB family transcription factor [Telluria aromaticivorans]|uniref:Winged helix-turn-helix transcriptional regulator n=1 Tax=Telluria aromaticivorans TaxID=2725995 RepID=A0A7Y2JYR3_9BURK|nr:metalloregulator ArsR/SmtB family transcription factor [Telluria aromaticivorans]NNG23490.1 winged helix-turn-helix transcriptional regulator [Telluria aromaticivorans]